MNEMIINIETTGKTTGLHFDKFPLGFLGKMEIGRASEIFFNPDAQNWEVVLPGNDRPVQEATGFGAYDEARNFEVNWLQGCMKAEVPPYSEAGRAIAASLRVDHLMAAEGVTHRTSSVQDGDVEHHIKPIINIRA